jgi:hypothetical protein
LSQDAGARDMKNALTIPAEKITRPPDKRENARLGRAGAVSQKAGGLFTTYDSRTSGKTQLLAGPRFERLIERVHALGPRIRLLRPTEQPHSGKAV